MIVACNNNIKDIYYSGFTITKVYACGGELVYVRGDEDQCASVSPPTNFVLNYNAKNYDTTTHTMPMLSGQSNNIDCVLTGDVQNVVAYSDHLDLTNTTNVKALVTGAGGFNNNCCMTIIAKAYKPTDTTDSDLLVNRTRSGYNWMFRWSKTKAFFQSTTQTSGVTVSPSEPNIVSVVVDTSSVMFRNHTTGVESVETGFTFNSRTPTSGGTLFSEYADYDDFSHYWKGNFYWIFMTREVLTADEIQDIIDFNESCYGITYAWRLGSSSDYVCEGNNKYYKEYYQYTLDGYNWKNVQPIQYRTSLYIIEPGSYDCQNVCDDYRLTYVSSGQRLRKAYNGYYGIDATDIDNRSCEEGSPYTNFVIGECVRRINDYTFCNTVQPVTIPKNVEYIGEGAFANRSSATTTFEGVYPPIIDDTAFSGGTGDIIVPCEAVNRYKAAYPLYADRITSTTTGCTQLPVYEDDGFYDYIQMDSGHTGSISLGNLSTSGSYFTITAFMDIASSTTSGDSVVYGNAGNWGIVGGYSSANCAVWVEGTKSTIYAGNYSKLSNAWVDAKIYKDGHISVDGNGWVGASISDVNLFRGNGYGKVREVRKYIYDNDTSSYVLAADFVPRIYFDQKGMYDTINNRFIHATGNLFFGNY